MGVAVQGRSEVKGSWFVTGQRVLASRPDSVRDAVRAALPPEDLCVYDQSLYFQISPVALQFFHTGGVRRDC